MNNKYISNTNLRTIWELITGTFATKDYVASLVYPEGQLQDVIDRVYPVGSVYISADSTSPANLFGGTWEKIKDTFLLAAGDSYAAGSTGGEAMHTLTIPELAGHDHTITYGVVQSWKLGNGDNLMIEGSGSNATTSKTGGNQPHNNMPPYLTVNMWKRIG